MRKSLIRSFMEESFVRNALPADGPEIARLYGRYSRGRTGSCVRTKVRWTYLLDSVKLKAVFRRQQLEGYVFFDLEDAPDKSKRLSILEFVATTDGAQRGLLSFLAASNPEAAELEYTGYWGDIESSRIPRLSEPPTPGGPAIQIAPGPLFRIIRFLQAIAALAPNFNGFHDALTLLMEDPLGEKDEAFAVSVQGNVSSVGMRDALPAENPHH